jgi:hypothetical protein
VSRILENFKLESLDDDRKINSIVFGERFSDPRSSAQEALSSLKELMNRQRREFAIFDRLDFQDPEWQAACKLRGTLEYAVRLGYYWANAETEMRMEPFARAGLGVHKGAKKAGIESGNKRRAKADETWKPHALELARKLREADPNLSQHRLADEISFGWKLDQAAPGHTTLTTFISQLERAGTLARRMNS